MLKAKKAAELPMRRGGSARVRAPGALPKGRALWLAHAAALVALAATASILLLLVLMTRDEVAAQPHCPRPSWGDRRAQRVPYDGDRPSEAPERYTLLLNSFKRHDLLKKSVAHYAPCTSLDAIRVVWSEDQVGPPSAEEDPAFYSSLTEVRYDVKPSPSLNQRFTPPPGLRTMAVLSIDDDVFVPCDQVAAAFAQWQRTADQLVGWFPRGVALDSQCRPRYLLRDAAVLLRGHYSMVLTKGAFLHRDWLTTYSSDVMPSAVKSYVDTHHNCEDIAMAFLVANATGEAPVYVRAPGLRDLGQGVRKVKGISSVGGHAAERSACLEEFSKHFGGMALETRPMLQHPRGWLMRLSTIWDRAV